MKGAMERIQRKYLIFGASVTATTAFIIDEITWSEIQLGVQRVKKDTDVKQNDTAALAAKLRENLPVVVEIRRAIHRRPELNFQEFETAALIRRYLETWGVELLDSSLPTAVVARIRGADEGPTILVREDIESNFSGEAWRFRATFYISNRIRAVRTTLHYITSYSAYARKTTLVSR